jgi:geranylgeranyl diphosphate synthase type II
VARPPSGFAELERDLDGKRVRVERALRELWPPRPGDPVAAAVEYCVFAPAKRLRPILVLMGAEVLGADLEAAVPAACAVEMVHTASLVLDDLPCMDDAALRRGRPALHLAHGEATAVLAAFALLNRAFEVVATGAAGRPDPATRVALARELAAAVGLEGMVGGQAEDLARKGGPRAPVTEEWIQSRKTGALFVVCVALAALTGGATPVEKEALLAYARNLGLAFQIVDDLLDAPAGPPGTPGGATADDHRRARSRVEELILAGEDALAPFGARGRPLRGLARYLVARAG